MKNLDTILGLEGIKENFEANILDGDSVDYCGKAILDAKDCLEYFLDIIHSQNQDILKALVEEMPKKKQPQDNPIQDFNLPHEINQGEWNKCLDQVLEIINKRII